MNRHQTLARQRGMAMVIGMIMLVLLTLFVIAAVNMTSINMRIMGNTQVRSEALAAGQQAIEQVVSTTFPDNPQPLAVAVDINGDNTTDYNVNVAKPVCLNSVPIKAAELDTANPNDIACFGSGTVQNPGLPGSVPLNSVCANTQWDVSAAVTDTANSGATVTIHQGVGKRVFIGTPC
jgi:Tfp pilus assembly protein PilX